jgi:hypothetical protein
MCRPPWVTGSPSSSYLSADGAARGAHSRADRTRGYVRSVSSSAPDTLGRLPAPASATRLLERFARARVGQGSLRRVLPGPAPGRGPRHPFSRPAPPAPTRLGQTGGELEQRALPNEEHLGTALEWPNPTPRYRKFTYVGQPIGTCLDNSAREASGTPPGLVRSTGHIVVETLDSEVRARAPGEAEFLPRPRR